MTPSSAARRRYSQNGEDGIVRFILDRIGSGAATFVEIGASDGQQNCTRALAEDGWRGVWVEADPEKAAAATALAGSLNVEVVQRMITRDNVAAVIRSSIAPNPDVLSVDIDGNDWFVLLRALAVARPRLIVVEYNAAVGRRVAWSMPYDDDHQWREDKWHGVSLRRLQTGSRSLGYEVVACDPAGVNAFLVRADLIPLLPEIDDRTIYRYPMYGAPFGHPWRTKHSTDHPFDLEALEQIKLIGRGVSRVGDRLIASVDVINGTDSWLASCGEHPLHLAAIRSESRHLKLGPRLKLVWAVPPRRARPAAIVINPDDYPTGFAEITLVQEMTAWLDDLPSWSPVIVDVARTAFSVGR